MDIRDLPEEIRSSILSYSNRPVAASLAMRNDPMYLFEELLSIEPDFDIATILQQVRVRQRELQNLERKPVYQLYRLLERHNPTFEVTGSVGSDTYDISTTQAFADLLERVGFKITPDTSLNVGRVRQYKIVGIPNLPFDLDKIRTYQDLRLAEPGLSHLRETRLVSLDGTKQYTYRW